MTGWMWMALAYLLMWAAGVLYVGCYRLATGGYPTARDVGKAALAVTAPIAWGAAFVVGVLVAAVVIGDIGVVGLVECR